MSVAVGLGNLSMIVLCADRQMTDASAGLKFEGRKVACESSTGAERFHNIAFAYCGNPDMAEILFPSVIEALGSAMDDASDCDVFEREYFRQHLLPVFRSKDAKGMQTLIGLQTDNHCFLFRTKSEQVIPGYRELVGGGDSSVLRYLADVMNHSEMPNAEQALPFGIYLVMLANRYVDGCGFGADAVILEEGKPIRTLYKDETAKLYSKRFAHFERQMEKEFFGGEG